MPGLIVRSPEIVKEICVKDFDHFVDHKGHLPDDANKLWSRNLFCLKGQAWRDMRSIISPSFSSGKMKKIFELVCYNSNLYVEHLSNEFEKKGCEHILSINFKDTITRYTNDTIANSAFGLQVDSVKDKENDFYTMSKGATNFRIPWKKCVFLIHQFFPKLTILLKMSIFEKKVTTFFINLVDHIVEIRGEQHIKRQDTIGLLIEARTAQQKDKKDNTIKSAEHKEKINIAQLLTNGDIASHLFSFIIGGFESNSSIICFMAYELAANPDVQKRLIEEIDEKRASNGSPSYETITNSMTYMDMVVCETFRKWPINIATERTVTKPYTIQPSAPDEKPVQLEVGENIIVPIFAFHRDPKFFKNPNKFDPERFSVENKKNMVPYTYLPFGAGPRMCLGYKFAVLVVKTFFFHLLCDLEIAPLNISQQPRISKTSLVLTFENDLYLGLKRRR